MKNQPKFIDRVLQNRVATHVLFWFLLLMISTALGSLNFGGFDRHLINNLALLPSQLLAAYFLAYFQIPKLILQRKYLYFFISLLLSIFFFTVIARLSIIYIAEPFLREDYEQETLLEVLMDPQYLLAVYLIAVYLFPLIFVTIKTIKERFEQKHQLEILKKEKATTELKFLKAQIHPHFLFNTLNSLYALTLERSSKAPEVVVKLSEMLDYIIYQGKEPKVPVIKEIELIQNYIDLELLRYGDRLDLKFEHSIDEPQTEISPLILLTLVENAFKHGASKNLENPKVHIDLQVISKNLNFSVYNTKPPSHLNNAVTKKGLGSANIKQQLQLIYPEKYELMINENETFYEVNLKIAL